MAGDLVEVDTRKGPLEVGVLRTFAQLYSSWKTLVMNAAFFAAYYVFFYALILSSNSGFFLLAIPLWLLVLFVLASSALATVAVSYLRISFKRRTLTGVIESPVGLAVGALVATCSCNLPLIAPVLYFVGLNSLEVSGAISFLAAYQQTVVEAIVAINLVSIYYYLRQISRAGYGGHRSTPSA